MQNTLLQDAAKVITLYTIITMLGIIAFYHVINGGFTSQPDLYCEREAGQVLCVPTDSAY